MFLTINQGHLSQVLLGETVIYNDNYVIWVLCPLPGSILSVCTYFLIYPT